jgi:pro-apoptotic serine protease NMA111
MSSDIPITNESSFMSDAARWHETTQHVIRNVVSIDFCHLQSFDTVSPGSYSATGFIVDSERGYIVTSRHVAGPGPFWGQCTFINHEKVSSSSIPH